MSIVDAAPTPGGCPGWIKILLTASLAGNLVVVGLVIGHEFREAPREVRGGDRVIDSLVAMVPEERRELAIAHFAEARERLDAAARDRSGRLAVVLAAIRAEPYDPAALEAALGEMFDRSGRRTILRERLSTLLARLDPAEREVFAERFEERLGRR